MKTNYPPLKALLLLAMLTGILSCNDHRIPNPTPGAGRLRVKSITEDLPDNKKTVSAFQYDGQGRLGMIVAYQTPDSSVAQVQKTVYRYNGQNRLIQVERKGIEVYSYSYFGAGHKEAGLLAGITLTGYSFSAVSDAANQLVGSSRIISGGGISGQESRAYTFTGSNLTSVSIASKGTAKQFNFFETRKITYTYDTNVNPFYGELIIPAPSSTSFFAFTPIAGYYTYFGGFTNILNLSKNNVLSDISDDGRTNTYAYTYNAEKLPISRITTTDGRVTETLTFAYELY